MAEIRWKVEPDEDDYESASEALSLLVAGHERLVERLKGAELVERSASAILRAAFPAGAPFESPVDTSEELSPLLLIATTDFDAPLIVADGTDRLCAVFAASPAARVPCKLIHLP